MKKENEVKNKILQKLIEQMDERMLEDLKGKSPKFAKVSIQSDDPKLAEDLKDKLIEGMEEDKEEMPVEEESKDDMEEDDLERLKELYNKIK